MTEKQTFAISAPREAFTSVESFFQWFLVHMNPGIPVDKTVINTSFLEDIYKNTINAINFAYSFDRYKAEYYKLNAEEATEELFNTWVSSQTVEFHVTQEEGCGLSIKTLLFGPDIQNKEGLVVGHEVIYEFFLEAGYSKEKDNYYFQFGELQNKEVIKLEEDKFVPIKIFPAISFEFESSKEKEAMTFTEVHKELGDRLCDYFKSKEPNENSNSISLKIEIAVEENTKQLNIFKEFTGGLSTCLKFKIFAVEIPYKEGFKLFTKIEMTAGSKVSYFLPIIHY